MEILQGSGASGGIVSGSVYYLKRAGKRVERHRIADVQAEHNRFAEAVQNASKQLETLYEKAVTQVGEQGAQVFEIHRMMLEDADFCNSVKSIISIQQVNAEYAVAVTAENFSKMFRETGDSYMQERAADVKDISDRLLRIMDGEGEDAFISERPVILAAEDLTPSETVQLDKKNILAFLTAEGSNHSHTAILARTMGIPAVVGLGAQLSAAWSGKNALVDGNTGEVILSPDADIMASFEERLKEQQERKRLLEQLKGLPSVTRDGKTVSLYANIGNPSDLGAVLLNDAEGIGLFRSEFLYLEGERYPTEEEQFQVYRTVAESMAGKRVIFRTLDIGADKQAAYLNLPKEENPAMGFRAIRICLEREDVFRTQLRALYRASAFGKVSIMFPMIASLWEIFEVKRIAAAVRDELEKEEIPFRADTELGIMIETPAAALISAPLAAEVDFFSIGTNDLTQYTLAVDRQNQGLERFYDPHHPALLELIRLTAENAHQQGIWVGICGELAADLSMTETFLSYGIDELSVAPGAVLPLREKIRAYSEK